MHFSRRLIVFLATVSGISFAGVSAEAKTNQTYTIVKQHFGQYLTYYRAKKPVKSVYAWNAKHTKKLFNLKNYSKHNLSSTTYEILRHGNTKARYLRIYFYNGKKRTLKTGYVWHGYLEKGLGATAIKSKHVGLDYFYRNADYVHYLQQSSSQGISRSIMKLFPRSRPTLDLTRLAIKEDGSYYIDQITPRLNGINLKYGNYSKIIKFPKVVAYLNQSHLEKTSVRIKHVRQLLDQAGYPEKKRAKLSSKYQLGINIVDSTGLPDWKPSKMDYGSAFVLGERQ